MTNSNPLSVTRAVGARIPTQWGEFQLYLYQNNRDHKEHLAFVYGDIRSQGDVLVRVHSECFTGDVLGSQRCDCGEQLEYSLCTIANHQHGVLIYLRQEGRGIGLAEKLRAYNLQDQGFDTVEANIALGHQADVRDYSIAAAILENLEIKSIHLLTNNPAKIEDLTRHGINVSKRVSIQPTINAENLEYLKTKVDRMQHLLTIPDKVVVETRRNDEGCG